MGRIKELVDSTNGTPTETRDEQITKEVLRILGELGAQTVGEDSLRYEGDKFILPANLQGNMAAVHKYLDEYEEQQSASFEHSRQFFYRPWDGANAFQRAMKRLFGTTGTGVAIQTMFGKIKPQFHSINISATERASVPWRRVGFSPLEATFDLGASEHDDYGTVFNLTVTCPRKFRTQVEAFFTVVEDELKTNSIYRGKAFTGGAQPNFLDLSRDYRSQIVYSEQVIRELETEVWTPLRHAESFRQLGMTLKRAFLLEGPYGTGKSTAGIITAQEAVANGWTFIQARPGKDDLMEVLQTAQLYAPAVVWYEDIDVVAAGKDDGQISQLLDVLDGITNKGVEVIAGFTTNHVENIQRGVLRPGRLDAVISVHGLDAAGFEKLVKVTVPADRLGDIDYKAVAVAFEGMLPAFASESIRRAMRFSLARNQGVLDVIETVDLVAAAQALRPQLRLMNEANEGVHRPLIEQAMGDLVGRSVAGVLANAPLLDYEDDVAFHYPSADDLLKG